MKSLRVLKAVLVVILLAPSQMLKGDLTSFPICKYTGEQSYPAVSGNNVVWQDNRINNFDIYRNDPANMTDANGFLLYSATRDQKYPSISGDIVVCQDYRAALTNPDIYRCLFSTGAWSAVCTDTTKQEYPAISGNTIVWQDDRTGTTKPDIYRYDLTSGESAVCDLAGVQSYAAISGNMVVWQDSRNGNMDIYGKNIDTGEEFEVCTDANTQQNPAVSGNIVVWEDYRNLANDADIYGKDILTGEEFVICAAAGKQVNPAIDGNIVVWEDQRDGNSDIYGFRVTTRTVFPICTIAPSNQLNPAVSGNLVVWQDDRNTATKPDIYGAYIPQPIVLTILGPNGGESFIAGKQCDITWQSSGGTLDFVKLEYSINGGQDFTTIAASTANNGLFVWQPLPDVESDQCLVQVSDMSVGGASDTSDAVFTIFRCDAALTADLSGDCIVDFTDFALFSGQWLGCGTAFDPDWCP